MLESPIPLPCPHCGKMPKLRESWTYGRGRSDPTRIYLFFECRRWLGLRRCLIGKTHVISKEWYDLGVREATKKWNEAVVVALAVKQVAAQLK